MTHIIQYEEIDENFPVPGKLNDTQTFRDNFRSIKEGLKKTNDELTYFHNITVSNETSNDLQGNILENVVLDNVRCRTAKFENISDNFHVDFLNGHYQTIHITNDTQLKFLNFPRSGENGKITLEVYNTFELPVELSFSPIGSGVGIIKKSLYFPKNVILGDDPVVFEVWIQGSTLYLNWIALFTENPSDYREPFPTICNVSYKTTIEYDNINNQSIYHFNGKPIRDKGGIPLNFEFRFDRVYQFDISDPSNKLALLSFSTSPDTSVPSSITPYTDNIIQRGEPGTPGAHVQIKITDDTPDTLYIYGHRSTPSGLNTNKLGGEVPIRIKKPLTHTGFDYMVPTVGNYEPIDLTSSTTYFVSTDDPNHDTNILSLQDGYEGQVKNLVFYQKNRFPLAVYAYNVGWQTTEKKMIFNDTGNSCILQFLGGKWFCIGNNGVVFE